MTNFIFKSSTRASDLQKIVPIKLEAIQNELRHQRSEHSDILRLLERILNQNSLQKQVDDYYETVEPVVHPEDKADQD